MIVTISSPVHQSGVSTVAQAVAFSYASWANQPVLLLSIKTDEFYKAKCGVSNDYNSKFVSIINASATSRGDLAMQTYKITDVLYYYRAHSSPSYSQAQHQADLETFLERAQREFPMIFIDLDDSVESFRNFLSVADTSITVLPPDKMILMQAQEKIQSVLEDYEEEQGLAVKSKLLYVINKMDGALSKSTASRLLKAPQRHVFTLPYDNRFISNGNLGKLIDFTSETLLYRKSGADKALEVKYKRLYEAIRKG